MNNNAASRLLSCVFAQVQVFRIHCEAPGGASVTCPAAATPPPRRNSLRLCASALKKGNGVMLKKEWLHGVCFGLIFLFASQLGAIPLQRIEEQSFGSTPAGEEVQLYTLRNAHGMVARVIGYGATITELRVPDRDGRFANVVMGAESLDTYLKGFSAAASVMGRVANRIANARFTLDGREFRVTANAGQHRAPRRSQRVCAQGVARRYCPPSRTLPPCASACAVQTATRSSPARSM